MLRFLTISVVVCLLGLTATGEIARWEHRFDIVNHFRPLWFAIAVGVLIAAVTLRFQKEAFAAGLLVLAQGQAIVPEMVLRQTGSNLAHQRILTLATINMWVKNGDPARLLPWLMEEKPDIIAFQEFPPRARMELLGPMQQTWPHVILHDGVAIASRYPLTLIEKVPGIFQNGLFKQAPAIVATATMPDGKPLTVFATHLSYPFKPDWQSVQLAGFPDLVRRFSSERFVVMGDLNMTPWSQGLKRLDNELPLTRLTRALPSWPAPLNMFGIRLPFPVMPIDHIYATPDLVPVLAKRGPFFGSDHYPVVAKVVW
jgi:endonuclease/exonuclease/phosphatase (EEP) superfamily protein YafD